MVTRKLKLLSSVLPNTKSLQFLPKEKSFYHRELSFLGPLLDLTVTKVAAWNASGGVFITQKHHQNKNNNFWYHRFQVQGSIHKLIS